MVKLVGVTGSNYFTLAWSWVRVGPFDHGNWPKLKGLTKQSEYKSKSLKIGIISKWEGKIDFVHRLKIRRFQAFGQLPHIEKKMLKFWWEKGHTAVKDVVRS